MQIQYSYKIYCNSKTKKTFKLKMESEQKKQSNHSNIFKNDN